MKMKLSLFGFLGLTLTSAAHADLKQFYFQRFLETQQPIAITTDSFQAGLYDQKINPADPSDARTFKQRYYFDDTYAAGPESPVLFYLCGEAVCSGNELRGIMADHAKKQKAYLIALEHRYYGQSQPFDRLTTANLKFLSTDNALLDAAGFQKWATQEFKLAGKWIAVGGSYPGSLAAYYRLKYPELVVGALASSAPVEARANFEAYDRWVSVVAGPECGSLIKEVSAQVEASLSDPKQAATMRTLFSAEKLVVDEDFLYLIADMAALAIQYGYRDHFCSLLAGKDPLKGYADFTQEIFKSWNMTALSGSAQGALDEDPKTYADGVGNRQWFYQSCTEYGYWQNAYHDTTYSVRSPRINPAYHENLCRRLFGINTPVNTDHINDTFYKPLQDKQTTQILFTNGEQDPWSKLSLTQEDQKNSNPALTLYTIKGAAHCDDLRRAKPTDSESLKGARSLFGELLSKWLAP